MPLLQLLTPRPNYRLTPWLIWLNGGIYLLLILMTGDWLWFSAADLARMGGNFGPLTLNGQWWRLLSALFIHAGLLHLLFNCLILANIGLFLEPLLGRWRLLLLYLTTGLFGSLASLLWHLEQPVVSIGASGAIFGLYGFFLVLMLGKLFTPAFSKQFLKGTLVFILINLAIGMLGFIDNAAHLGGLLSGALIGLIWLPQLKKRLTKPPRA